jgi:hypothetical protein
LSSLAKIFYLNNLLITRVSPSNAIDVINMATGCRVLLPDESQSPLSAELQEKDFLPFSL